VVYTLEFCWRNVTPNAAGKVNYHLYLGQVLHEQGVKDRGVDGCFPLCTAQHTENRHQWSWFEVDIVRASAAQAFPSSSVNSFLF